LIDGRAIVLIDDVITTGATAEECARTLKAAGAAAVFVITLARALRGPI
jgi:predicted amidophosphoribosyltransferase